MLRVAGVVGSTVFAGAMALRIVEPETGRSMTDALWWSLITVSTVGYGDIVPLTDVGCVVAAVLVFFGIGVFGYAAGFMGSLMEDPEEDEILAAVKRIERQVEALGSGKVVE
jgi:voltage-gated potassium channel